MSNVIRILISDDHAIVREGLRALIEIEDDMELVGEASDGIVALDKAISLKPDVILMDLVMPRMDGVEAIKKIREKDPDARILVLSSFTDEEKVLSAVQAGAMGFVLKDSNPEDLLKAIREIHNGESPFDPSISRTLLREFTKPKERSIIEETLTEREIEILKLLAQGLTTAKIAETLVISERTVGTHISNILTKMKLENRIQAVLLAIREGLIEL